MIRQTIALFKYLIHGLISKRLLLLLFIINLVAFLLGGFIAELALVNSEAIFSGFQAEFLRYSFLLLLVLLVISNIVEDFESRQFERIFCMPLARWQYIVSQILVVILISALLAISTFPLLLLTASIEHSFYWMLSLWLEFLVVGHIALLTAVSLEKVPSATILTVSVYMLARIAPFVEQMLAESVALTDSLSSQYVEVIFNTIMFVIPSIEIFAQSNVLFSNQSFVSLLVSQALYVLIYSFMLVAIVLVDLYRKELSR